MKIMILTNDFNSKLIKELKKNSSLEIVVSYDFEDISKDVKIVFAHNYDKKIPENYFNVPEIGIFVIHSSDLPKGRGWAPIYYSIANKEELYVISLLKISKKIDEGNIFLKLKIKKPLLIANINLREIDEDGSLLVVNKFIELLLLGKINNNTLGLSQDNSLVTYNKKRSPQDNFINLTENICEVVYKILATNENHPAFIELNGQKIYLSANAEKTYLLNELEYIIEEYL
jgi:methionyl-tRNA formyltransferase